MPPRKFFLILTVLTFSTTQVWAQIPGFNFSESVRGNEFFVGNVEGKPLIRVNLISGVRQPGVYHVPIQTNLAQLLSYAGGASDNADLSDITVRSDKTNGVSQTEYDLTDILKKPGAIPVVQENDTVRVPVVPDHLARASLVVSIIAGLATAVLSVVLINNYSTRNNP